MVTLGALVFGLVVGHLFGGKLISLATRAKSKADQTLDKTLAD